MTKRALFHRWERFFEEECDIVIMPVTVTAAFHAVRKQFCARFKSTFWNEQKRSFYQDRLGTNTGKTQKREGVLYRMRFMGRTRTRQGVRSAATAANFQQLQQQKKEKEEEKEVVI